MEQRKLAFLITHLIVRVRDYPPEAVDELLVGLDKIERKYDLVEKLTPEEWDAVLESRDDVVHIDRYSPEEISRKTRLSKRDRGAIGRGHFDEAVKRARLRDGEEQGDIADLLFALLDEYFLDIREDSAPGSGQ